MTDYVTDKDLAKLASIIDVDWNDFMIRRLLNGMIEREVKKSEDDRAAFIAAVWPKEAHTNG